MPNKQTLLQNIFSALTVSFVALSLGAAFGILSGRGAFAGMLASALIAIITSLFGGTRIQCSGPTGPMTAVTAALVAITYESLSTLPANVSADQVINQGILLAGVFMIVFGILRLGKYITLVPNVVISGFMNGIAIIIWLDQLRTLFGFGGKVPIAGPLMQNVFLATASLALIFIFQWFAKKYFSKIAGLISGTLFTLIFMTVISYFIFPEVERVQLVGSLKSFDDLSTLLASQIPTVWTMTTILLVLPFALKLSVLGYLDTLMTSLVIDKMTKEKTRANKELMAQGLANGFVAFLGGIPGAQATIRSVLMIKENATMRLAGVLVGVFALIEMIALQDYFNLIPRAVFVGVLLKVGYDVFDWLPLQIYLRELKRGPARMFRRFLSNHPQEKIFVTNTEILMIIGTTAVTVFYDLNLAVFLFTALFYIYNKFIRPQRPMRDLKPQLETEGFSDQ
jgi:sulfate permease, SulP family